MPETNRSLSAFITALCFELPADGSVPEWLELVPAAAFVGRDGRRWVNDQPASVVAAFNQDARPLPVDWEHATERPPAGAPVPKAAWIEQIEVRDGALWGRFVWTERGRNSVTARDYRFLSPVFIFTKDALRVVKLVSVALTDNPNLHLKAINSIHDKEAQPMSLSALIIKALGLAENATEDQAVTAINTLKGDLQTAQNSAQQPSLDKYVPRNDYDAAVTRAANAEQQLQGVHTAQRDKEIDTEIQSALTAGKITPPTVEYHKAQCRMDGGLERFRDYVKAAPEVGGGTGLDNKKADGGDKALNAEQQRVASMFGNSAEDLAKYGKDAA